MLTIPSPAQAPSARADAAGKDGMLNVSSHVPQTPQHPWPRFTCAAYGRSRFFQNLCPDRP